MIIFYDSNFKALNTFSVFCFGNCDGMVPVNCDGMVPDFIPDKLDCATLVLAFTPSSDVLCFNVALK